MNLQSVYLMCISSIRGKDKPIAIVIPEEDWLSIREEHRVSVEKDGQLQLSAEFGLPNFLIAGIAICPGKIGQ